MMARAIVSFFSVLAAVVSSTAWCESDSRARVALVIGNASYQHAPLRNPVNDARAIGAALDKLGFDVIALENASREAMQRAILEFSSRLTEQSVGLFYFAGHGIQARGANYLIPVDAQVESEPELKFQAVSMRAVLEEMEFARNRVNIVILDACRNNPFERRFRGGPRGLAAIDAARGTIIAYATAPGSVAADGDGDNGLYTSEFLNALAVPGLEAEEVFKRVRAAVTKSTNGRQVPWESSSLTGSFVFRPEAETVATMAPAPADSEREVLFWETIKDSDNPDDFAAYLRKYPDGTFADLARIRVESLGLREPLRHPMLLSGRRREGFKEYWNLEEGELFFKVFAMSEDTAWGYATRPTFDAARRAATARCQRHSSGQCRVFAIGDTIVWDLPRTEHERVAKAYGAGKSPWPKDLQELSSAPLSIRGYQRFLKYRYSDGSEGFRVFVLADDGAWSVRRRSNLDDAIETARARCEKNTDVPGSCRLFAVGDTVVWSLSDTERDDVVAAYRAR